MTMSTRQENGAAIRKVIVGMAPGSPETNGIADPRLVEDLGYDSLALFEMVLTLESDFGVVIIDDDEVGDIRRVSELEVLVLDRIDSRV
jgi:acyl carrier protein